MSESASNSVYLTIALIEIVVAGWKFTALRRDFTPTLFLIASSSLWAAGAFAMASPAVYRALGEATGHPSAATLPVYICILLTFAHFHLITLLWCTARTPGKVTLRRHITGWTVLYASATATMIALFVSADLSGPADPLRFNTDFADEPAALLFLAVFLGSLSSGTLFTFRQCRVLRLTHEGLQHAVKALSLSMLFVFGYVVCTVPAITLAAAGDRTLETVGVLASVSGSIGALICTYGLSGAAAGAWFGERRDLRALRPLWEAVVTGVDPHLAFSSNSRLTTWNVRFHLHRRVIEILDGMRALRPWVAAGFTEAAEELHQERLVLSGAPPAREEDLQAIATAAALRDAVERLEAARREAASRHPPVPAGPEGWLPGEKTAAADERGRLLGVARVLHHPMTTETLHRVQRQVVRSRECSALHSRSRDT
ncbi:MAB_1171c family putative transporter [Streptomyces sp. NPDC091406]|uniref:MAB_1171c family putative transporter n=1 Tax=unclassified Streptomyces TaxID=2593676 RepID=UPI00382E1DA1